MNQFTTDYVGLDVHKESIDISLASAGDVEVRHVGKVAGDLNAVVRTLRRLAKEGRRLHIVYEAGPCGFVLQRHLSGLGFECEVVAPSLVPKRSGERIKTDRRDSLRLARAARAGDLTAVRVPDAADEAMRDLSRAREDAVREQRNARHRLKALLLRNDVRYDGKKSWTAAHQRWLSTVKLRSRARRPGAWATRRGPARQRPGDQRRCARDPLPGLRQGARRPHHGVRAVPELVARILRGESVANMPAVYPREFHLAINLSTARILGITVPPSILIQANEVIE